MWIPTTRPLFFLTFIWPTVLLCKQTVPFFLSFKMSPDSEDRKKHRSASERHRAIEAGKTAGNTVFGCKPTERKKHFIALNAEVGATGSLSLMSVNSHLFRGATVAHHLVMNCILTSSTLQRVCRSQTTCNPWHGRPTPDHFLRALFSKTAKVTLLLPHN